MREAAMPTKEEAAEQIVAAMMKLPAIRSHEKI